MALQKFESNNRKEIGSGGKTHLRDVVPARRSLRKKKSLSVCDKRLHGGSVRKKQRRRVLRNVSANNLDQEFQRFRIKGLANLGNTCYFNSVVQVMLHCPPVRRAIETAPQ